ncbi:MAG: hypothetical protein IJF46_07260 [Bacteroidaceae bacterium]|nr:hypothetical protein [Bacteroidaceae bacterium]
MSEERYCPECNAPLEGNETFCDNCGARLQEPTTDNTRKSEGAIATKGDTSDEDISRNNVMGSINKTTTNNTSNSVTSNNIDSSTTTSTVTSNIQSSSNSIDNSTVNNNTTIVMGGKGEAEFCEVCGNPFDGKHARCPKCGKSICFDCKVKGKNRCVECEKKAINEYRMAYQELMLTTNGKIGAAGRQMMNRKAQELDVEDKKKSIEEEINAMYKSETKAQQPEIIAAAAATAVATATDGRRPIEQSSKSIGALSDQQPKLQPHNGGNSSGGSKKWFILGSVIAVILLAYIIFGGGNTQPTAPAPDEAAAQQEAPAAAPAPAPAPAPAAQQKPAAKPAATQQKAEAAPAAAPAPKKDPLYDAGMKAYEEGNGLEAVKKFKASGSAEAYYMLGVIYESGCGGIGKNAMLARQNFKKAANMGHAAAKAKL